MKPIRDLLGGMMSVLTLQSSGLYRYPYRNSMEGISGDIKRATQDIAYVIASDTEEEHE